MRLRLEVPQTAKTMEGLALYEWSKAEGDPIAFGDELCVLSVGRKRMLKRDAPVRARARRSPARRLLERLTSKDDGHRTFRARGIVLRIVASDEGVLRRQLLEPGAEVVSGTLLGVVTTTDDEALDDDEPVSAPTFRAIAETDTLDDEDDDQDDGAMGDDDEARTDEAAGGDA